MRAVTVRQPWAQLIVDGTKRIETRSWSTDHRGPLAIHSSAARVDLTVEERRLLAGDPLLQGYVLGSVRLVDCVPVADLWMHPVWSDLLDADEWSLGNYGPGQHAWILDIPRRLRRPVRATGGFGLWEWQR